MLKKVKTYKFDVNSGKVQNKADKKEEEPIFRQLDKLTTYLEFELVNYEPGMLIEIVIQQPGGEVKTLILSEVPTKQEYLVKKDVLVPVDIAGTYNCELRVSHNKLLATSDPFTYESKANIGGDNNG